jgi:hypothetical protein
MQAAPTPVAAGPSGCAVFCSVLAILFVAAGVFFLSVQYLYPEFTTEYDRVPLEPIELGPEKFLEITEATKNPDFKPFFENAAKKGVGFLSFGSFSAWFSMFGKSSSPCGGDRIGWRILCFIMLAIGAALLPIGVNTKSSLHICVGLGLILAWLLFEVCDMWKLMRSPCPGIIFPVTAGGGRTATDPSGPTSDPWFDGNTTSGSTGNPAPEGQSRWQDHVNHNIPSFSSTETQSGSAEQREGSSAHIPAPSPASGVHSPDIPVADPQPGPSRRLIVLDRMMNQIHRKGG